MSNIQRLAALHLARLGVGASRGFRRGPGERGTFSCVQLTGSRNVFRTLAAG